MLEKWKQRAVNMNLKKAVVIFVITGLVLAAASFAALYCNFQGRISGWKQQLSEADGENGNKEYGSEDYGKEEYGGGDYGKEGKEHDGERESGSGERERGGDYKERKERDWEDVLKGLDLSAGDLALIAGCGIIGLAIGIWYWALVLVAVCRKAYRMGVNTALWTFAALVFNLAALAVLYLYAMLKGTCANCGRVRSGRGRFCDRCGSPLKKECPQCGAETDASSVYCGGCGRKLDEDK